MMTGTLVTSGAVSQGLVDSTDPEPRLGGAGNHSADQRPGFSERIAGVAIPALNSIMSSIFPDLPPTYTVKEGDTISSVADSFGVPTPAVLTLNGLNWNTVLHPGQVLKLSAAATKKVALSPPRIEGNRYTVQNGESLSAIAERFGVSTSSLERINNLAGSEVLYAGQEIRIPGTSERLVERAGLQGKEDPTQNRPAAAILAKEAPAGSAESHAQDKSGKRVQDSAPDSQVFDAADIKLAERPSLIRVMVDDEPSQNVSEKNEVDKPESGDNSEDFEGTEDGLTQESENPGVGEPVSGSITPLNEERRGNAETIINVGKELGVSDYGIVIALATAMQESSLRNINWGDRDSIGLFQQRPSSGWGAAEQIIDPVYATKLFFGGPQNPNKGRTRGLLDVSGWESMALTVAAQKVQISAYPNAYAKWEPSAWAWLYELT